MIEAVGLTGCWGWTFIDNKHVWSPGLYRILGVDSSTFKPSYQSLIDFIHPEDRRDVETANEVLRHGVLRDSTIRIIRPDGAIRILSVMNEVYYSPSGKPLRAAGTLFDITDRDFLIQMRNKERQRRRAIFDQTRTFSFTTSLDVKSEFPPELYILTGLKEEEVFEDPFITTVSEEREHWRATITENLALGHLNTATPLVPMAIGGNERLCITNIPVHGIDGNLKEWACVATPLNPMLKLKATGNAREGFEQAIEGRHIRAARSLLDWSMANLAVASGVSISSVRRIEEGNDDVRSRVKHHVLQALRTAGVIFSIQRDATISISHR